MPKLTEEEHKEMLQIFYTESEEQLKNISKLILKLEKDISNKELLQHVLVQLHEIKGSSGMAGFMDIQELAHVMEDSIKRIKVKDIDVNPGFFDIFFECIEKIVIMKDAYVNGKKHNVDVGKLKYKLEMVLLEYDRSWASINHKNEKDARNNIIERMFSDAQDEEELSEKDLDRYKKVNSALSEISSLFYEDVAEHENAVSEKSAEVISKVPRLKVDNRISISSEKLDHAISHLEKIIQEGLGKKDELIDLKEELISLKKINLSTLFDLLPAFARSISGTLRKEISFEIIGGEIEVNRKILEKIKDPMIHLIRNAVDHGIEKVRTRQMLGKNKGGKITVSARLEKDNLIIEISDDGQGVDTDKIKKILLARRIVKEEELKDMSYSDICNKMFEAGFSTKKDFEVSSISGRGVGLEIVKENIESIGGKIEIKTIPKKGTTFTFRIPNKK